MCPLKEEGPDKTNGGILKISYPRSFIPKPYDSYLPIVFQYPMLYTRFYHLTEYRVSVPDCDNPAGICG